MMAVWGLTGLQKPQVPMYEPIYDMRVIVKSLEMAAGRDVLTLEVFDKLKSATGESTAKLLDAALKKIPGPVVF
jgi:oleate hydratase